MTWLLIGIVIGAIAKTLLPFPPLDDRIRKGWAWLWSKIP